MLRLWGRTNSSNVMKVWWLLEELGLAYERIDAGLSFGRNDTPEYRRMSPLGQVPAIEDDGFALFESNAILRYLCDTHGQDGPFHHADPRLRGTVDAWMDFQQTALGPPQSAVFHAAVRTSEQDRDPARIAAATARAGAVWAVLDQRLATRAYVAGEHLTLADFAFGPHAHRWFAMRIARPDAPHLRGWYDRLLARPAYARTCAGPVT